MFHDHRQATAPCDHSSQWAAWLAERAAEGFDAKAFFVTLTFDRYRARYRLSGIADATTPTRDEVSAGTTSAMPRYEAYLEYRKDVHRWYLRLLAELFGGNYKASHGEQPRAIGYFDEPVFKGTSGGSGLRPGDRFPHVHMVMVLNGLPGKAKASETLHQAFLRLFEQGRLGELWRRWNPDGEVHVRGVDDVRMALDYASKSSRRDPLLDQHQIILPFA